MDRLKRNKPETRSHLSLNARSRTEHKARIGNQLVAAGNEVLRLRNFSSRDSCVMARMYAGGIALLSALILYTTIRHAALGYQGYGILSSSMIVPAILTALVYRHIRIIRHQSDFYFHRATKRVQWRDGEQMYVGDWNGVKAGPTAITESAGNGVVVCFYLEMAFPRVNAPPGAKESECTLRLESNNVSDPRNEFTAQVWEYIRHFMDHGPKGLPQPSEETWWWYQPPRKLYLTPKEALLRYLPWRTGVPGESEGKAWWTLPIWAVMFPYNMLLMLCWWATCKVFKVRPADPPPEAFAGSP